MTEPSSIQGGDRTPREQLRRQDRFLFTCLIAFGVLFLAAGMRWGS